MEELAQAVELTQQMLAAVKNSEWEQVNTLSNRRQTHLEKFFAEPIPQDIASDVETIILKIQSLDLQISVYCDAEREQLAQQLQGLNKQKQGTAAYHQTAKQQ